MPTKAEQFISGAKSRTRAYGDESQPLITPAELLLIVGPCFYCGGEADGWDHKTPIIRGGPTTADNLVPCCRPCNNRKQRRTAEEFMAGLPSQREPRPTVESTVLRVPEAATIVGISRAAMYDLVMKGRIRHLRVGPRTIRIRREVLDQWMRDQEVTA